MKRYAILANPGHNWVYFEASRALSCTELTLALEHLGLEYSEIKSEELGGVFYQTFTASQALTDLDIKALSTLSFTYAIFELTEHNGKICLLPILVPSCMYMNGSISSILKYSGKTNELFTRLMINVGLFSIKQSAENIKILDPIAGKGTTLFDALALGFDAYGIELNDKSANESYVFLKKYLETGKYKHQTSTEQINMQEKGLSARRSCIQLSHNKEEMKSGVSRHWEMVSGNSMYADRYFKKNSFQLIVGDLPYGIQHGNVGAKKQGSATRSPKELISLCAAPWYKVLKPGGAMVLSWNSFVYSREQLSAQLESVGFHVKVDGVYSDFEHRVDQAIKRDIVVAVKE